MKTLCILLTLIFVNGMAFALIEVNNQYLLDDPYFTTSNSTTLAVDDGTADVWHLKYRDPVENNTARLVFRTSTSGAGSNDSFSATVDLFSQPAVTNLPYYDVNSTELESIEPMFERGDIYIGTGSDLLQTNQPTANQDFQGWYVVTLDTAGGIYTATSDSVNLVTPTATNAAQMGAIVEAAWNNITWDSDPFSGGAIPYTNINSTGIEFFFTNITPRTTGTTSWWNMERAPIRYSISIDGVDEEAPVAPAGLTATGFPARVELEWEENTDIDLASYSLMRGTNSGIYGVVISNLFASAYSDTNVVNDTMYYYAVAAVDHAGNISVNNTEVSVMPVDNPPPAPTNVTATALNAEVALDWIRGDNPEQDFAYFNVYRSEVSGNEFVKVASNLTESAHNDTGVVNNTMYYYVVTSVDAGGQESVNSDEVSAMPENFTLIYVSRLLGWHSPTNDNLGDDLTPELVIEGMSAEAAGVARQLTTNNGDDSWSTDDTFGTVPIPATELPLAENFCWGLETSSGTRKLLTVTVNNNTGTDVQLQGVHFDYSRENATTSPSNLVVAYVSGDLGLPDGTNLFNLTYPDGTWTVGNGGYDYADADVDLTVFGEGNYDLPNGGSAEFTFTANGGSGGARIALFLDNLGFNVGVGVFTNLSVTYNSWSNDYRLVGGEYDDDDSDGLVNLYEYGLDGDPTNGLVDGKLPVLQSGSGGYEYIHGQRSDDPSLLYYLELTDDLINPNWTNDGYSVVATNVTGNTLDFVTNSVLTVDDQKFIRLIIEQN